MPLVNQALVLVTDGRKTLFFRNHGDKNQIDLRTEAHEERDDPADYDRELKTDAPGVTFQSSGHGHSTYEETDFKQQEEDRWAKHAAEVVNKRVLNHEFEDLIIIAPPKTLGELRKDLHKEAEKRVRLEIAKEMTNQPIKAIEELIENETAKEEPPEVLA